MESMTPMSDRLERDLSELVTPLQLLAAEIRLLIHWADSECKQTWDIVEPRLFDFELSIETATDALGDELRRVGHDLHDSLQALRKAVRRA